MAPWRAPTGWPVNSHPVPNTVPAALDHLVLAVPDLAEGCAWFEDLTSVKPVPGGRHPSFGTHNALVHLGNRQYLELLAADAESEVPPPRWMGVDAVAEPTLTRWAVRTTALERDAEYLRAYDAALGTVTDGRRARADGSTLSWRLTLPTAAPTVAVIPFLIDWSGSSAHPTDALPPACRLVGFSLFDDPADGVRVLLARFGLEVAVDAAAKARISVRLDTPKGIVQL